MTRNKHHGVAVGRTILACDHTPARLVRAIIERYQQELRRAPLLANPRVMALANLKVGEKTPWPYAITVGPGRYIQSADRIRARLAMGEPDANWSVFKDRTGEYAKRVS